MRDGPPGYVHIPEGHLFAFFRLLESFFTLGEVCGYAKNG